MALVNCPECKKEISSKAKTCPNCGMKQKKKMSYGWLIIIGLIAFLFYIMSGGGDLTSSSSNSDSDFLAYSYAENFVEKKLKSPSTAEFPGVSEKKQHITKLGGRKYKIESWVDSQNGFGAMARTKFSCIITFVGSEVHCDKLKFE